MSHSSSPEENVVITDRDIVFDCPKCKGELVVDRDGEGMKLDCVHCGATVLVPLYSESKNAGGAGVTMVMSDSEFGVRKSKAPTESLYFDFSSISSDHARQKYEDLKLQLKENESQRVETRGHLNRTMLQAHRYQLQLQKLVDRQSAIEQELAALKTRIEG
jgi:ribosomal protein L37AE/L43A